MNHRSTSLFSALLILAFSGSAQITPSALNAAASRPAATIARGNGVLQGTVKDATGGIIPNASVTITDANGAIRSAQTGADGTYSVRGIAPGTYTVSAAYQGLQQSGVVLVSVAGAQPVTGNVTMAVQEQKQQVTVTETSAAQVSTDPANNASALTLKQEEIQALPDDPDDLQADLQALAGPGSGPGGNQIYIDGFTGGRLPPKESIREVRINSNPFSAEFDKLGFGRIQIFTKPGSDKFHGQGYYNISDDIWNSRNPFLSVNPPFRSQIFGGNVSGPIGKKASFFLDVERRNIDDNGIIVATVLPYALNGSVTAPNAFTPTRYQTYQSTPQRRTTVSPRIDYQLNQNNTLSARFTFLNNDLLLTGVGAFNLQSAGYSQLAREYSAQLVETSVLSPKAVNETHFQFERSDTFQNSQSNAAKINVAQSFVTGGSGYGNSYDLENNYELQNYTSLTNGTHVTKFGFRIRATALDNYSERNFNGTYSYLGGFNGLKSIQQYAQSVQGAGVLPSQYTVSTGNPYLGFYQLDYGPFIQDDWKLKPNLTISLGLRWESQTNVPDKNDWAPRVAVAWSPDSVGGRQGKTVIRGGWGMFYDRFQMANVLNAYRFSLTDPLVSNYTITDPSFGPGQPVPTNIFDPTNLNTRNSYVIDSHLHSPYLMQTAVSVERQISKGTRLSLNYTNARGNHELRTVDINAPVNPQDLNSRPFGTQAGNIYLYESTGVFKQNQLVVSLNTAIGRRLNLFTRYVLGDAHSDTDGISTLPANQYNFAGEWGRSALDTRHSFFAGGSMTAKWGLRLSPFIVAHTGAPFNITTGTDYYNVGNNTPTARPSVLSGSDLGGIPTPFGLLSTVPISGYPMIARNAGTAPGYLGINLRVSKTWGFGSTRFAGPSGGASAGGGGGRGRGGPGGMFGDSTTEHRYNLTLGIQARNILNHENLNTPNGAITSPLFLQSTNITGGFGAEATSSNQRRIDLQLRFQF